MKRGGPRGSPLFFARSVVSGRWNRTTAATTADEIRRPRDRDDQADGGRTERGPGGDRSAVRELFSPDLGDVQVGEPDRLAAPCRRKILSPPPDGEQRKSDASRAIGVRQRSFQVRDIGADTRGGVEGSL